MVICQHIRECQPCFNSITPLFNSTRCKQDKTSQQHYFRKRLHVLLPKNIFFHTNEFLNNCFLQIFIINA